jgi:hypothetical protein
VVSKPTPAGGRKRVDLYLAEAERIVTAGHFIYIPVCILLGIVIGWILGGRAARDAYLAELRRRESKKERS